MYIRKTKVGDKIYTTKARVYADLTSDNEKKMNSLIEKSGLKESQIINKLISKSKIPSSYPFIPTKKELNLIRLELQKIGLNINQVTKKVNSDKNITRDILINSYLDQLYLQSKKANEISKKVEELIELMTESFK